MGTKWHLILKCLRISKIKYYNVLLLIMGNRSRIRGAPRHSAASKQNTRIHSHSYVRLVTQLLGG
jgi:hypothetical protein